MYDKLVHKFFIKGDKTVILLGYERELYMETSQDSLPLIKSMSELQKAINHRYSDTGMRVLIDKCWYNGNTLYLEFGSWEWKDKKRFNGKQYFRKRNFGDCDVDGYDDPQLFLMEVLNVTRDDFGTGGIALNWYRPIRNVKDFIFDRDNCSDD